MGEIFRRETAEHPEPFTGERLTTAIGGQVQIEHYHRYLFARALVPDLDVLDVASGEGYGSALLAQVARSVIGVEYPSDRAGRRRQFSAIEPAVPAGRRARAAARRRCVDVVVSFETIEHFDRQDDFLREVRRVLRPDGSVHRQHTGSRRVFPGRAAANPFHVHELSRHRVRHLLHGDVSARQLLMQQRALIGSALLGETGSSAPPLVFDRRGETHFEACIGLPRAPYLIAVASDREPPPLPPSLYIDRGDVGSEQARIVQLANRCARRSRTLPGAADLSEMQAELAQIASN